MPGQKTLFQKGISSRHKPETMIPEFGRLDEEEQKIMAMLPVWVTLLIAGADNNIEDREIGKAVELIFSKHDESQHALASYYQLIARDIEIELKGYRAVLPEGQQERLAIITEKLAQANTLWPKIDQTFAAGLYESLKELANAVAEASGGFLGYGSVSPEEAALAELKMLQDPGKLKKK